MSRLEPDRRKFLAAGSTGLAIAVAGCSSVLLGGDDDEDGDDDDDNGDNGDAGDAPEGVPQEVHDFLMDGNANLYADDPSVEDATGQDQVTIANGAGDGFAFDPPCVRVDAGTEIVWEWTGEGGAHNVASQDESDFEFRSGDQEEGDDITWSTTFEEAGNALYVCEPHIPAEMFGAVIVE